jgi:hypothetical protein
MQEVIIQNKIISKKTEEGGNEERERNCKKEREVEEKRQKEIWLVVTTANGCLE